MKLFNYAEQAADIQKACAWLNSLGFTIKHSRIEKYKSDCEEVARRTPSGTMGELLKSRGFTALANSLVEAHEFIAIYNGLRPLADKGLTEQLKLALQGKPDLTDESPINSGNRGRNESFYLYLKSLLVRAGLEMIPHHSLRHHLQTLGWRIRHRVQAAVFRKKNDARNL